MSLDEKRVAELFVPVDNSVGTGYLVSPHLVLTAKHVVAGAISSMGPLTPPSEALTTAALADLAGDRPRCRVRLLTRTPGRPFHDAVVVWWHRAADAALLGVFGPAWDPPSPLTSVPWTDLDSPDPVSALAVGFPDAYLQGALRESKEITGTILPVSGYKNGRWVIDVEGTIGRAQARSTSAWAGMSGAALFVSDSLIGLIQIDADPADRTRMELWAEPLRAFAEDPGLVGWLMADGGPRAWTRAARNPGLDDVFLAYVRTCYDNESTVKFQQVDMDNQLLDLFIDVPIDPFSLSRGFERSPDFPRNPIPGAPDWGFDHTGSALSWDPRFLSQRTRTAITLLLDSEAPLPTKVLLRGGPGQGKSTITQYLCQLHRLRLLRRPELERIPPEHRQGMSRYPLRVDLKAMALWVRGKNPYSKPPHETLPFDVPRSVEGFLADHVFRNSDGRPFGVKDLQDFLTGKQVLLVFDGLDEVTDPDARKQSVDALTAAVDRLEPMCASLQVIVTSRPVNHGNAPVFPERGFARLDLGTLTPELIESYAQRWVQATKLGAQQGPQLVKSLMTRLHEPQVADLARYPMQLAILLTLMRRKPESLPDRRTPLYDGYVEIFFDREAGTDKLVADHISLVQKIHRHVAWLLQSGREKGQFQNGMSRDRLLSEVRTLAKARRLPTALADRLVPSVERNYMLVSRTGEGFEFEVDPLREYFCAIHLFETADDSTERGKAARFEAMARNPAWFEVTRFYAGCAREGELPALALKLRELLDDHDLRIRLSGQLRILGCTLLNDRVFTDVPLAAQDLAKDILDDLGFRLIFAANLGGGLTLPEVARDILVQRSKRLLTRQLPPYTEVEVAAALRSAFEVGEEQLPEEDAGEGSLSERSARLTKLYDWWYSQLFSSDIEEERRTRWLECGIALDFVGRLNDRDAEQLLSAEGHLPARVAAFLKSRVYRVATLSPTLADAVRNVMVSGRSLPYGAAHPLCHAGNWLWALGTGRSYLGTATEMNYKTPDPLARGADELFGRCTAFGQACDQIKDWDESSEPWSKCVETGRRLLGDGFVWSLIAAQAAGFARDANGSAVYDLTNQAIPLVSRGLSAWYNASDRTWWARQADSAKSASDREFVLLLLLCWSSAGVMVSLADWVCECLAALSAYEYRRLMEGIQFVREGWAERLPETELSFAGMRLPERWDARSVAAYAVRASGDSRTLLYEAARLRAYRGNDVPVLTFCLNQEASGQLSAGDCAPVLRRLKAIHRIGEVKLTSFEAAYDAATYELELPTECAMRVAERARDYPSAVVTSADAALRKALAADLRAVSDVAQEDRWFESAGFRAQRRKTMPSSHRG